MTALRSTGNGMDIDVREPVQLGGSTQWIRIRAASSGNPVLLLVQMGPGLPMINQAQTFGRVLSLEDDFTVIYWDQRGCGLSLRSPGARLGRFFGEWGAATGGLRAFRPAGCAPPAVGAGFGGGGRPGAGPP